MTERLNKMRMELRRGVLVLVVLAALEVEEYGYSLRKKLMTADIEIEEGTLYPLIRRLESYELLESEWRVVEGRKRRFYKISEPGQDLLKNLKQEWYSLNKSIDDLLTKDIMEK